MIERVSPTPTEPVRRALALWSRNEVTHMACAVIVAEGGGFRSATVRGVGIALTALAPHTVPFKFAGSVVEGAELLGRFLPKPSGGPVALALAVAELRARWEQSR